MGRFDSSEWRAYLIFGPSYVLGYIFGILPYAVNKKFIYSNFIGIEGRPFEKSKTGEVINRSILALVTISILRSLYRTKKAFRKVNSCTPLFCDLNVCRNICGHFVLLWMNAFANFTSIYGVGVYRRRTTLDCLNEMNELLRKSDLRISWYSALFGLIFLFVHCISILLHWRDTGFAPRFFVDYMEIHLAQILPIISENVIAIMLVILETAYADINSKIEQIIESDNRLVTFDEIHRHTAALNALRHYHWKVTDVVEKMSCFGRDFLAVGISSTFRFVYMLVLMMDFLSGKETVKPEGGLKLPPFTILIFFIPLFGKFCYLCYRCEKVAYKACKTETLLFALRNKCLSHSEDIYGKEIEEFLEQVRCREISFNACEFFTLNLSLIRTLLGVTITYFIVLLQFQSPQEKVKVKVQSQD